MVLPLTFHEHLTAVRVFPIAAVIDRKALQIADGKPRKKEASCPTHDSTGTLCQSKVSHQTAIAGDLYVGLSSSMKCLQNICEANLQYSNNKKDAY